MRCKGTNFFLTVCVHNKVFSIFALYFDTSQIRTLTLCNRLRQVDITLCQSKDLFEIYHIPLLKTSAYNNRNGTHQANDECRNILSHIFPSQGGVRGGHFRAEVLQLQVPYLPR